MSEKDLDKKIWMQKDDFRKVMIRLGAIFCILFRIELLITVHRIPYRALYEIFYSIFYSTLNEYSIKCPIERFQNPLEYFIAYSIEPQLNVQ